MRQRAESLHAVAGQAVGIEEGGAELETQEHQRMAGDAQGLPVEHGRGGGHDLLGLLEAPVARPAMDGEAVLHAVLGLGVEGAGGVLADDDIGEGAVLGHMVEDPRRVAEEGLEARIARERRVHRLLQGPLGVGGHEFFQQLICGQVLTPPADAGYEKGRPVRPPSLFFHLALACAVEVRMIKRDEFIPKGASPSRSPQHHQLLLVQVPS